MPNGWAGLGEGLERGLRIGNMMEEAELRREDREYEKQQREYQQQQQGIQLELSQMQLSTLKDAKSREDLRRSNDSFLYSLAMMKRDPNGYGEYLKKNPKEALKLQKDMQRVGNFAFGDTGKAGKTDMIDLVPMGQDESGEPLFGVAVKNEKGKSSRITQNRMAMADGDPEQLFTLDDLGRNSSALNALIAQVEAQQISLGDSGALDRMRASEALQSERDYEEQQATTKFGRDKILRGITARGKRAGQSNLKMLSKDPNTGEINWGVYDEETQSIIPLNGTGGGTDNAFSGLPEDQQRALAVENLKSRGIPPQQSTYFGLGDDKYSDEQVNAEIGRQSLGGGGRGIGQAPAQTSTTPQPAQSRKVGDRWINSQGKPVMLTEQGVMMLGQKEQPQPAGTIGKKGIGTQQPTQPVNEKVAAAESRLAQIKDQISKAPKTRSSQTASLSNEQKQIEELLADIRSYSGKSGRVQVGRGVSTTYENLLNEKLVELDRYVKNAPINKSSNTSYQVSDEEAMRDPKLSKSLMEQRNSKSALTGELGLFKNPNGSYSSERSITVEGPNNSWVNIPLLVKGQSEEAISLILSGKDRKMMDSKEIKIMNDAERVAIERAKARRKAGQDLPTYKTVDEAVKAAENRSNSKGS